MQRNIKKILRNKDMHEIPEIIYTDLNEVSQYKDLKHRK
jgi:hypothetical protein